jgi:hypothetical protein
MRASAETLRYATLLFCLRQTDLFSQRLHIQMQGVWTQANTTAQSVGVAAPFDPGADVACSTPSASENTAEMMDVGTQEACVPALFVFLRLH